MIIFTILYYILIGMFSFGAVIWTCMGITYFGTVLTKHVSDLFESDSPK